MKRDLVYGLPRDLYIASGARAVSMLGSTVVVTALLLDLHANGAGTWAVAGVLVAGTLPIVLLAPVIGIVVDRYDSRLLIVVSGLWQAALCGLLAFVGHPLVVLTLVTLTALGSTVANPVFIALTRVLVPSGQLAVANGLQQGAVVVALMAGPALSGLLTGLTGGARVPLLLDAGIFLAITWAGLLIGTRRRPAPADPARRTREGFIGLFDDRALGAVVLLAVLLVLVVHLIYVAQVYLVRDTFGASALTFGLLQATHTVGLLFGTVVASRLSTARRILLGTPLAAVVMSVAIVLIGVAQSMPATFVLYVVAGFGASTVSVSVVTLLLLRTPEPAIGRALASFTAVHRAAGLIAYGFGGWIVGVIPPTTVYVLSGVGALIAVLITAPTLRRAWLEN